MQRAAVEFYKTNTLSIRVKNLEQILRVLQQDASMKDVFAELDGFVAIVNSLTILNATNSTSNEQDRSETPVIHVVALSFEIMIASMTMHTQNVATFEVSLTRIISHAFILFNPFE